MPALWCANAVLRGVRCYGAPCRAVVALAAQHGPVAVQGYQHGAVQGGALVGSPTWGSPGHPGNRYNTAARRCSTRAGSGANLWLCPNMAPNAPGATKCLQCTGHSTYQPCPKCGKALWQCGSCYLPPARPLLWAAATTANLAAPAHSTVLAPATNAAPQRGNAMGCTTCNTTMHRMGNYAVCTNQACKACSQPVLCTATTPTTTVPAVATVAPATKPVLAPVATPTTPVATPTTVPAVVAVPATKPHAGGKHSVAAGMVCTACGKPYGQGHTIMPGCKYAMQQARLARKQGLPVATVHGPAVVAKHTTAPAVPAVAAPVPAKHRYCLAGAACTGCVGCCVPPTTVPAAPVVAVAAKPAPAPLPVQPTTQPVVAHAQPTHSGLHCGRCASYGQHGVAGSPVVVSGHRGVLCLVCVQLALNSGARVVLLPNAGTAALPPAKPPVPAVPATPTSTIAFVQPTPLPPATSTSTAPVGTGLWAAGTNLVWHQAGTNGKAVPCTVVGYDKRGQVLVQHAAPNGPRTVAVASWLLAPV